MKRCSYFGLKRGKRYLCSLDDKNFKGKFEYKLHKHYLVYRKIGDRLWRGVWNYEYYNDMKASYLEMPND